MFKKEVEMANPTLQVYMAKIFVKSLSIFVRMRTEKIYILRMHQRNGKF